MGLRALGRVRRSLAVIGALLIVSAGYAAWIGSEPFLARVRHADYASRWVQTLSSLPIARSFPLFGIGLGTYQDIYLRYQPAALAPGRTVATPDPSTRKCSRPGATSTSRKNTSADPSPRASTLAGHTATRTSDRPLRRL